MTIAERIAELVAQHGSLRKVALVLRVTPGYLSRLQSGEKSAPSGVLLHRLGLRQIITYEKKEPTK